MADHNQELGIPVLRVSPARLWCYHRAQLYSIPSTASLEMCDRITSRRTTRPIAEFGTKKMEQGTIKRITDKGFGFISTPNREKDMFFHSSALEGVHFNDLREGQKVTFNAGEGPKGPRAENVQLVDD